MDPTKFRALASALPRLAQTGDDQLGAFLRDRLRQDADVSVERARKVRDVLRALCEAMAEGDGERWDRVQRAHEVLCPAPPPIAAPMAAPVPAPVPAPIAMAIAAPVTASPAGEMNVTLPHAEPPARPALPFQRGAPAAQPKEAPKPEPKAASKGEGETLPDAPKPSAPALPFIKAAAAAGWNPEGTLLDAKPAPLAAPAAKPAPPAKTVVLEAAAEPAAGAEPALPLERYAALCVELEARPGERAAVLAKYGLAGEAAREALERAWASRFQADPAAAQRFQQQLAHFRGWLARRGR